MLGKNVERPLVYAGLVVIVLALIAIVVALANRGRDRDRPPVPYSFRTNPDPPPQMADGEFLLGTFTTPQGSTDVKIQFRNGEPVSELPQRPPAPGTHALRLPGATAVEIDGIPTDETGAMAKRARWQCSFDCTFLEGSCMVCGRACTNGRRWVFGQQTWIDC